MDKVVFDLVEKQINRAIYREEHDGIVNLIVLEEVNKHEY